MDFKPTKKRFWLWIFAIALLVLLVVALHPEIYDVPEGHKLYPLFRDFGGNLTGEILGGLLFLVLGIYFGSETEAKIDKIVQVTIESEKRLKEREDQLKREREIFQFKRFIETENYHNVRFPLVKGSEDDLGLEYTIYPIRDSATNEPVKKISEMYEYYLVRVKGPAHLSVMDAARRERYADSPIRDGQNYFCQYFNDSWHMSSGDFGDKWYEFYFSGKMGHVEYGESANEFMFKRSDPFENLRKVGEIQVDLDYNLLPPGFVGGFNSIPVFLDESSRPFVRISDSGPLRVFETTKKQEVPEKNWILVIEPVRGFVSGEKLEKLKNYVQKFAQENKIEIPKVHWYNLPDDQQII